MKATERIGRDVLRLFQRGAGTLQISQRADDRWQVDAVQPGHGQGAQSIGESLARALAESVRQWPANGGRP